ncbi:MAG: HlyD family efflux transporter periplasmic adaptor subunit [Gammaproteobacteria bacterium]|jgi:RND family efflux transporter MFP subunit|nr:HlyD family efflux transporter periplasmic adaptor subunit [Gammaproteobacteria bacterium]
MAEGEGFVDNASADRTSAVEESVDKWTRLKEADSAEQFAAVWLEISCELITGVRRAVVVLGPRERGPFAPAAIWPVGVAGSRPLGAAAELAIRKRGSQVNASGAPTTDQDRRYDVVAVPVTVDSKIYGSVAVEVEHDPERDIQALISSLEWNCTWLESFVRGHWTPPSDRLVMVLETIATSIHHQKFQEAVTAVATELAGRLGCERVCIGFLNGKHTEVKGVSHSATFGKKANLIRAIEAVMDEAIDQQATVIFPPNEEGPLQVTRAHAELHEDQGKFGICTVPFSDGDNLLGAFSLEMPRGHSLDGKTIRLCEHLASLVGPVLDIKRKEDRWLPRKALDSAKAQVAKLAGPGSDGRKIVAGGLFALLLFLVFAKGDFRVTADARLEGTIQRVIAAPMAGYVASADVRAGDMVEEGEVIAQLDDRDLRLELLKWSSQRSQRRREQSEALAARDRAQAGILAAQIEQAEAQVKLLEEQLIRTVVTAPFDGVVVSGDLSQSLGAPVERGEVLFEVAPLNSYRVILEVDERDIGEVLLDHSGMLALTGMPGDAIEIHIDKITPISTAEEGRNYFRVEASLTGEPPPIFRPGMEGVGKIDVGRRNLVWIWTHKISSWMRMFLWSWWP